MLKDLYEAKYQLLINKWERTSLKRLNDSKAFIQYSNDMDDIYNNIQEYNSNEKRQILIVFDDMITDMLSNKNLNPIVTELFIRGRKLNTFLVFIAQSYFARKEINSKYLKIWITWWIIFSIRYSRSFWVYHQKVWNSYW